MKKIISVLLCVLMLMAIAAPAASATDVVTDTPVVFIRGASRHLYASDESDDEATQIFPLDVDLGQVVSDALKPCLEELAAGLITGNYEKYCDELYNTVAPLYEDVILDKNGEASDGSGDGRKVENFDCPVKTSNFGLWDYDFGFDLRLSPLTIADDLKTYIDMVRAATGKKVSLVGRCFGGNVISAYLAKYEAHAAENVESVVMYISSTVGIDLIGALFAGEIKIEADNVDRFVEYVMNDMGVIDDPTLQSLVVALVDLLNYAKVLGLGTDALQYIIDNVTEDLVPRLALACYGTFPSYWSMVPVEYYEKARDNVFAGQEEEYAGMIAKLDDYYNNVQLTYEDVMARLEAKGVAMTVIAKYDVPVVPLYDGADSQGDFVAETTDISFGATTAPMGKTLSDSYIEGLADKRFVSADKKVDASTCLYPEKTWFLKNLFHTDFPDAANYLIREIVNSKGQMTVFSNESYPQYLDYDVEAEKLVPVTELDPAEPEKGSGEERFTVLIRFFTALLNFFADLINGEISFDGLFGGNE
ncbi:MAG: hypothetical protein IJ491_05355 [Clostridia bacterium]|nr:hypothetical protein [Clostridia bacterium]